MSADHLQAVNQLPVFTLAENEPLINAGMADNAFEHELINKYEL